MKRALPILVFLFIFSGAKSQEKIPITVDSMLVNIEKTGFTSGILYERVTPWARLKTFNDTTFVSGVDHFEQALYELYLASHKEKFMDYKDLRAFYSPDSLLNHVDIGIINASFHSVNYVPENVEEGGIRMGDDSLFVKIDNGKPAFLEQHVVVAAPLKKYLKVEQGGSIVYHFNSDFFFEDVAEGKHIMRLTANFGTSSNYTLIENGNVVNQEISVQYEESGPKLLKFTASFADDTQITAQAGAVISIFTARDPEGAIKNDSIFANIGFQGDDEIMESDGFIKYRIFYHTNNGNDQPILLKPIIIIDGFDPGDKRKIQDKDSPKPADEHRSIEEIMTYPDDQNDRISILDSLRALGYDVVIVNHPTYTVREGTLQELTIDGGADYIERNAMAHIALYQELNEQLATNNSNEELVIVGPSMGGQISRYALAYMEKKYAATQDAEWQHNCRLWISVDSPHLGANVPIGVQMLLNYAYYRQNSVAAGEFVVGQLQSAAARQQMIEQVKVVKTPLPQSSFLPDFWYSFSPDYFDGRTISQGFSQDKGHPYFIQYYNKLYSNGLSGSRGYPQNVRRIALVNGSLTNSNDFKNPFGYLSTEPLPPPSDDQYANSSQKTFRVVGRAHFVGDIVTMETYFMPDTGDHHRVATFGKRSGLFGDFGYHHMGVANYNSRGSLDNAPGGWYPTQQELAEGILESVPCEWQGTTNPNWGGYVCVNHWDLQVLEHVSSFIPTVSALGFSSPDFNWYEKFDRNLISSSCGPEIPFDNYYGPKINEQHTSFTEDSVDWLLDELDGDTNYPEPTVYLDHTNISGPNLVCNEDQVTYSIPGCTVSVDWWTVSSNLSIVSSDEYSVTVELANPNANGEGFVMAHFAHDSAKRSFWVGVPEKTDIQTIPANDTTAGINTYTTFDAEAIEPGLQYVWRVHFNGASAGSGQTLPNFRNLTPTSINSNYIEYIAPMFTGKQINIDWGNVPRTYTVSCRVKNGCSEYSAPTSIMINVNEPDGDPCDEMRLVVYPNPVEGQLNINMIYPPEGSEPCFTGPSYYGQTTENRVYIYNLQGNVEYSNTFYEYEFSITELDLQSGHYILSITSANGKNGQEVIIVE